jgi:hypothetical protein
MRSAFGLCKSGMELELVCFHLPIIWFRIRVFPEPGMLASSAVKMETSKETTKETSSSTANVTALFLNAKCFKAAFRRLIWRPYA